MGERPKPGRLNIVWPPPPIPQTIIRRPIGGEGEPPRNEPPVRQPAVVQTVETPRVIQELQKPIKDSPAPHEKLTHKVANLQIDDHRADEDAFWKTAQEALQPMSPMLPHGDYYTTELGAAVDAAHLPRPAVHREDINNWMPKKRQSIRKIGEGTYGVVSLCCDVDSLRLFVAKETIIRDKENMAIAENEVERLKQLNHEHVITYYGSVQELNKIVIYMEYLPAGSLRHMINKVGPLEEKTAVPYIRQILNGLAYIHRMLILHCDLKCDNLLVDGKGGVKIGDFGIAVQMMFNEANVSFIGADAVGGGGTLYFMAPEVVKQERYGRSADVWSLGCTIVEMLTSLPPYYKDYPTPARFMGAVSAKQLSYKATELLPSASVSMQIFLSQLLVDDREKRGYGFDAEEKFNDLFLPGPADHREEMNELILKKRRSMKEIGKGTYGVVWLCCDTDSLRLFVAKETVIRDKETIAIAENEVERLKQLNHKHVIAYFGSVQEKNKIVTCMEYFPAGSFRTMIDEVGPLTEKTAIPYICQILSGLAYIHRMLILHCNLKCSNLLLDGHGGVKIGNFGIAVQMMLNEANKSFIGTDAVGGGGTLYFMAPEILKQELYGRSADVWSLGCTIVEMLTSVPPYQKNYPMQVKFMGAMSAKQLSYKATELLPNASVTMQIFLSTLFADDREKRGYGFDAEEKFNKAFPSE